MRESMGAAWIFSIVITFIMIFTAYLAVSINYAKAFRIKNHIISIIEDNEGLHDGNADALQNIDEYLFTSGYKSYGRCDDHSLDLENENWTPLPLVIYPSPANNGRQGVCVYYKDVNADDFCSKRYYRVITFFTLEIPYLGNLLTFSVKGNTNAIYDLVNNPGCIRGPNN